jgi:hypothetical protein
VDVRPRPRADPVGRLVSAAECLRACISEIADVVPDAESLTPRALAAGQRRPFGLHAPADHDAHDAVAPRSWITRHRAAPAVCLPGPLHRRRIGSTMSTNRRRKEQSTHCYDRCGGAHLSAARHGDSPRPANSGSTWPHGRGAAPGNRGPNVTPQEFAEIRSRPGLAALRGILRRWASS